MGSQCLLRTEPHGFHVILTCQFMKLNQEVFFTLVRSSFEHIENTDSSLFENDGKVDIFVFLDSSTQVPHAS